MTMNTLNFLSLTGAISTKTRDSLLLRSTSILSLADLPMQLCNAYLRSHQTAAAEGAGLAPAAGCSFTNLHDTHAYEHQLLKTAQAEPERNTLCGRDKTKSGQPL